MTPCTGPQSSEFSLELVPVMKLAVLTALTGSGILDLINLTLESLAHHVASSSLMLSNAAATLLVSVYSENGATSQAFSLKPAV